jgi:hypothetical protein
MQKYGQEVVNMGYSVEAFAGEYRTAIRVRPTKLRSW